MNIMEQIGGILNQYAEGSGKVDRQQARNDYDQIASTVPPGLLGALIGPSLSSLGNDQVHERIFNSATEMTPQQRGGFLSQILGGLRGSGIDVGSFLQMIGVSNAVEQNPEQASPEDVAKVAAQTERTNPTIFQQAMSFFAEHPTLVKVLGTMAITAIARNLAHRGNGNGNGAASGGGIFGSLGF